MSDKQNVKLYVFHYIPGKIIADSPEYIHIWAGKNGSESNAGFIGDDTGDNISERNNFYSELTGLYWIWKNDNSDIVGSCHYRRYFTMANFPLSYKLKMLLYYPVGLYKKRRGLIYTHNLNYWQSKILSKNEVLKLLEKYDAVLPKSKKFRYSVEEHYKRYHNIDDLNRTGEIIRKIYPEYYLSFETVLAGNRMYANNMFIMKRKMFEELMEWLFSILFEFEKDMVKSNYTGYQERILGFLSERLITTWFYHNKVNSKELSLIYFKKLKSYLNA